MNDNKLRKMIESAKDAIRLGVSRELFITNNNKRAAKEHCELAYTIAGIQLARAKNEATKT